MNVELREVEARMRELKVHPFVTIEDVSTEEGLTQMIHGEVVDLSRIEGKAPGKFGFYPNGQPRNHYWSSSSSEASDKEGTKTDPKAPTFQVGDAVLIRDAKECNGEIGILKERNAWGGWDARVKRGEEGEEYEVLVSLDELEIQHYTC